ncbi:radical SAM protein [Promethearchaeum syntrophicum]|uniref:Radical SAM protein n=1 Tax=Promethearchaeum syntrophicum TaxID=2594042 RepID=A0A5B9D968_9ARCH|nr:radical SAM protein [Candidatus Prometheoarchaeum syntrophicum]QEE15828.1 Radical SAM superfamily protein [Candidatus Prometheoarchaeum syntrophicum]
MHELNMIKKPWREDHLRIALVYPNIYSSMAGLTIQTLYALWNKFPNVICERFFMPSNKEIKTFKSKNLPPNFVSNTNPARFYPAIRSMENQMPLKKFDIIAFSINYELDFPNLVWILDNSHIPFLRNDRMSKKIHGENEIINEEEEIFPIILAGGPVIRSNPLPLEPFIDAAFIGEIEPVNDVMINSWFNSINSNSLHTYAQIKRNFLKTLQNTPGFWIPQIYNFTDYGDIERVYVKNLDEFPHPIRQIIPKVKPHEKYPLPFGESFYAEINRGCPHFCRFCMTGSQLKPFRNRSLENLKEIIISGIKNSSVNKVVLIGSSVTDHPKFRELCKFLIDQKVEFSIPSIRIETLSEELASLIAKSGMRTVAFAPETGTDRLRLKINKKISNEEILKGAQLLLEAGIPNVKLYILYGLPFETKEDIDAIPKLVKEIAALGFGKQGVRLSINPFIPKAHTPFESYIDNFSDANLIILKEKLKKIYDPLKGDKQIKFETLPVEEAYIQTLLSLGGTEMSELILKYYQTGREIKKWYRITRREHLGENEYIIKFFEDMKGNSFGQHPWNFISQKLSYKILEKEWDKTRK